MGSPVALGIREQDGRLHCRRGCARRYRRRRSLLSFTTSENLRQPGPRCNHARRETEEQEGTEEGKEANRRPRLG